MYQLCDCISGSSHSTWTENFPTNWLIENTRCTVFVESYLRHRRSLSMTLFCLLSILNKKSMNSICFFSLIWQDWHYQALKFVNLQDYPGAWKHSHLVCVCACIWLNVCSLLLLILTQYFIFSIQSIIITIFIQV